MGMFTGVVYSEKLHMLTTLAVVLPQDAKPWRLGKTTPELRTLILLHGLSDNWAAWPYRSRIMTYAEEHYVAVLMPEVGRGFYQDMVYGEQYFTFVSEELPKLAHSMFGVPVDPESLMVAGVMPAASSSSPESCECVVEAGWMTRLLTSATLASSEKILSASMNAQASACPPLISNVKMEAPPLGK